MTATARLTRFVADLQASGERVRQSVTFFVPTTLVNPTNERSHWSVKAKRAKAQREAVAMGLWRRIRLRGGHWTITAKPETPKRITLTGHVARLMDDDNLRAALKSCRDGLQDCGLIHSDGPKSGHVFEYAQQTGKPFGVTISVSMHP